MSTHVTIKILAVIRMQIAECQKSLATGRVNGKFASAETLATVERRLRHLKAREVTNVAIFKRETKRAA